MRGAIRLFQLLHARGHAGRSRADDLACDSRVARVGLGIADAQVTGLLDDILAVRAEHPGEEVLRRRLQVVRRAARHHVEGMDERIASRRDLLAGRGDAVDTQHLHGIVDRSKREIAERGRIAGDGREGHRSRARHHRGRTRLVDLLAVRLLHLDARQLHERAARARAVLAAHESDFARRIKALRAPSNQQPRGNRRTTDHRLLHVIPFVSYAAKSTKRMSELHLNPVKFALRHIPAPERVLLCYNRITS